MKKMVKRALALGICVVFVLSAAVFVSAASATFFTKTVGSHRCTGRGTVTDGMGQAVFNATALPGQPVLPDEAYNCEAWVFAYSNTGRPIGATYEIGDTSVVVTLNADSNNIHHIGCLFEFNGEDLGTYFLFK